METRRQATERHAQTVSAATSHNMSAAARGRGGIARTLRQSAAIGTVAAMLATAVPAQARASRDEGRANAREAAAATIGHEARGSLPPLTEMIAAAKRRAAADTGTARQTTILEKDRDLYCEVGRDGQRVLEASAEHQQARAGYREAVAKHNAGIDAAASRTKRNMVISTAAAVGVIVASHAIGSKAHAHWGAPRTSARPGKYIAIGAAAIGVYRTLRDAQTQPGGMTLQRAQKVTVPEHLSARFDQRVVRAPDCDDTATARGAGAAQASAETTTPRQQAAPPAARSIRQQAADAIRKTWSSVRGTVVPAPRPAPNKAAARAAARVLSHNNGPSPAAGTRQAPAAIAGDARTAPARTAGAAAPARPTISNPARTAQTHAPGRGNGNGRAGQSGLSASR